jgi:hypothetical protein
MSIIRYSTPDDCPGPFKAVTKRVSQKFHNISAAVKMINRAVLTLSEIAKESCVLSSEMTED